MRDSVRAGGREERLAGSTTGFVYSPELSKVRPVIMPAHFVFSSRRRTELQHHDEVRGASNKGCEWEQVVGRSGTAARRLGAGKAWSAMWRASSRSEAPSLARLSSHRPACSQVHTLFVWSRINTPYRKNI